MAVCFGLEITADDKEPEMPVRYYIRSSNILAEKFASAIPAHWHIVANILS